ncbi:putative DNA-directed RNA polymerase [Helianthus anomalus]
MNLQDYVGNKRLELSGQLLALLFEDLFKSMNDTIKLTVEKVLSKSSRSSRFDISQYIKDSITSGLERSLSTGNWDVGRFKMHRKGITQVLYFLVYNISSKVHGWSLWLAKVLDLVPSFSKVQRWSLSIFCRYKIRDQMHYKVQTTWTIHVLLAKFGD